MAPETSAWNYGVEITWGVGYAPTGSTATQATLFQYPQVIVHESDWSRSTRTFADSSPAKEFRQRAKKVSAAFAASREVVQAPDCEMPAPRPVRGGARAHICRGFLVHRERHCQL